MTAQAAVIAETIAGMKKALHERYDCERRPLPYPLLRRLIQTDSLSSIVL